MSIIKKYIRLSFFPIINSFRSDKFKELIMQSQQEREKHVIMKKISMKSVSEIAKIIKDSK